MRVAVVCNLGNYINKTHYYNDIQEIEIWLKKNGGYRTCIRHKPFEKVIIYAPFSTADMSLSGHRLRVRVPEYEQVYIQQTQESHYSSHKKYYISGDPVIDNNNSGSRKSLPIKHEELMQFLNSGGVQTS